MQGSSQRAREVFLAAIEGHGPENWDDYVKQACNGDTELLRRVRSLLSAHRRPNGMLDHPNENIAPPPIEQVGESVGDVIGPYKLLEKIGEGGFGVVFMAEQLQPVRRRVAIKIVKPGMDTRQVVARFEAERQALALMDHPNIALVFDGGSTQFGRPFFVMELVRGIPITDFCEQNRLSLRQRLALFADVCNAVQHAHQKGIIHRDLKPSNVMVTEHDVKPVVKIIDFGIAKAMGFQLTEKTLFTNFAQFIGTPMYMSPEQARMSGLDVDTRSDVYSLGVLLYELVTGTTPFDKNRLQSAAYDEIIRIIREEEPVKPSTKISTMGRSIGTMANDAHSDPKKLVQSLRGELDWIVMKALEKDRNRRYDSAGAFAADVQRYLNNETVLACPPTAGYRLRKLARRHKVVLAAGASIMLALTVGAGLAVWQAVHATKARELAQARKAEAEAILQFFADNVIKAARPTGQRGGKGINTTLREALEGAIPYVQEKFAGQPLVEARLRQLLGESFFDLGEWTRSEEQYRLARELFETHLGQHDPSTMRSTANLAVCMVRLGRTSEMLQLLQDTLAIQKTKLGPEHADTQYSMEVLALCYNEMGRFTDALKISEPLVELRKAKFGTDDFGTISAMVGMSNGYAGLGRHAEAAPLREAIVAHRKVKLGPEHPDTLAAMNNLGNTYLFLLRYDDSLKINEEVLAGRKAILGPDHPDTINSMNNVARCFQCLMRYPESCELFEEVWRIRKVKLGIDHPQTLETMSLLAYIYVRVNRQNDALELRQEMVQLSLARLGPTHPSTLDGMISLAESLEYFNRGDEALRYADACIKVASSQPIYPKTVQKALSLRLRHYKRTNEAAGCLETARTWDRLGGKDADGLYDRACAHAVTAAVLGAEDSRQAEAESVLAMELLKLSVAAGYRDIDLMTKDKDLDGLRQRPDFIRLMAELPVPPK